MEIRQIVGVYRRMMSLGKGIDSFRLGLRERPVLANDDENLLSLEFQLTPVVPVFVTLDGANAGQLFLVEDALHTVVYPDVQLYRAWGVVCQLEHGLPCPLLAENSRVYIYDLWQVIRFLDGVARQ